MDASRTPGRRSQKKRRLKGLGGQVDEIKDKMFGRRPEDLVDGWGPSPAPLAALSLHEEHVLFDWPNEEHACAPWSAKLQSYEGLLLP